MEFQSIDHGASIPKVNVKTLILGFKKNCDPGKYSTLI